ncbi:MAG: hypothetical protein JF587_17070 [Catenulisporales bacterium]|nr:hypothetical protein [Catenulisporales bacterium]
MPFQLATALHAAGIILGVPGCSHCGRARVLELYGSPEPTCHSCAKRNADGSSARGPRNRTSLKACPAGRHHMGRTARLCLPCADEQATAVIEAAVVEAGVPTGRARTIVAETATPPRALRQIARWLQAGGSLADPGAGTVVIQRFRNRLSTQLPAIKHTTCPSCRQPRAALRNRDGDDLVCLNCYFRRHREICRSCRREKSVAWRDEDGWAWCGNCRATHPEAMKPCSLCGRLGTVAARGDAGVIGHCCYTYPQDECRSCEQRRRVAVRTEDGPLCQRCATRPLEPCVRCGEVRWIPRLKTRGRAGWCVICVELPVLLDEDGLAAGDEAAAGIGEPGAVCTGCGTKNSVVYMPDGQRCQDCRMVAMRRREGCSRCGRTRRVFFDPGICADCLGIDIGGVCAACGMEDLLYAEGRCASCELARRADRFFGGTGEPGRAVARRLAASTRPVSTMHWLARSPVVPVLADLLRRPEPLVHEDLDAIVTPTRTDGRTDRRQAIENARLILVASGILPARNELSHRYETWAHQVLATVEPASERWLLLQFHRDQVLPSLQSRCRSGKATTGSLSWAQKQLRGAADLLAWWRPKGGIADLARADVDTWLAESSTHYGARDFLLWAIRRGLVDFPRSAVPRRPHKSPTAIEDHEVRADLVRTLLHDEGYPTDIRVAGLLVALYGQHLSRIVRIECSQVETDADPVRIKLGSQWLELPEPFGNHLRELIASGPRRRTPFTDQTRWLFPGYGAGTHLSASRMGIRLAAHGIRATPMRNMALFQIAATVQPSTLGRLLGLHPVTAVKWVNESGGVYANYWSQFLAEGHSGDDDLVDLEDGDADDEPDEDPLDLLDELGIQ